MSDTSYRELGLNGLWKNNPALVQLLGLCPLLGVSNSTVNALGLGLATMFVLTCSNISVSLVRGVTNSAVRLPAFVMIIAGLTTCIELLMQAFTYDLYRTLGIFIPLITTNCVILGRADGFAARHRPLQAAFDGLMMGCGFACVLVVLGSLRELFGTGSLFANMQLLFGPLAEHWKITLISDYKGFLLAVLPPGAFIALGLLIALKNRIDERLEEERSKAGTKPVVLESRRVRITGAIE